MLNTSGWQTLTFFLSRPKCHALLFPLIWTPENIRWGVKPIIMQFFSSILYLPLLSPFTFLSTFFSKIRNPRSSLKVRDQITHPHTTTGKIILLHISVPVLLDCKWEEKDPRSKGGEHSPDLISSLFLHACNFSFVSVLPK